MSTVLGGSPGYIAPERSDGIKMNFTKSDERDAFYRGCDMYSVGVVLLLCHRPNVIQTIEGKSLTELRITAADQARRRLESESGWETLDTVRLRQLCRDLQMEESDGEIDQLLETLAATEQDAATERDVVAASTTRKKVEVEAATVSFLKWWSDGGYLGAHKSPQLESLLLRLTCERHHGDPERHRYDITETLNSTWAQGLSSVLPRHWKGNPVKEGGISVRLTAQDNSDELAVLQKMLQTADPKALGTGRDCDRWPNGANGQQIPEAIRTLDLAAAWRLHNPDLYAKFSAGAATVQRTIDEGGPACCPVDIRPVDKDLGGEQKQGLNERMLLHVMSDIEHLPSVMLYGTNERLAGDENGAVFGVGTYLAEDAGKCDQYAHGIVLASGEKETCQDRPEYMQDRPELAALHQELYGSEPSAHPGEVCYMLVCRTVMGHALRTRWNRNRGKGKKGMKRGVAMSQAEVEDMNTQLRELQKDLPAQEQVVYDYDQLYPSVVGNTPTGDNHVFHSGAARELQTVNGTGIRYNSLLVESCVSGKLWRAGETDMCTTGSECTTGRVHRFREIVLFHGEQIYPEYLIAYKRVAQQPPVEFFYVDESGQRSDYSPTDSALIADARARQLPSVKLVDPTGSTKGFEVHFTAVTANGGGGVADTSPSSRKTKAKKRGATSSPTGMRTGMLQVNLDNGKERVVEEKGTEERD